MKKQLLILTAAFCFAGCGGEGSSLALANYTGAWSGTWTSTDSTASGAATLAVASDGSLLMTLENVVADTATDTDITGTVSSAGSLSASSTLISVTGSVTRTNGTLVSPFRITYGGTTIQAYCTYLPDSGGSSGS